jgi:hypothetical protein
MPIKETLPKCKDMMMMHSILSVLCAVLVTRLNSVVFSKKLVKLRKCFVYRDHVRNKMGMVSKFSQHTA